MTTKWLIQRADGQVVAWHDDHAEANDHADRWNAIRDRNHGPYWVRAVSADEIVNEYPQDEIPEPGGYNLIAHMDDGDTLCEWCVRDPFNPITDGRGETFDSSGHGSGWHVIAWITSGDTDSYTICAHCNRVLVEDTEEDDMPTYKIVRFRFQGDNEVIRTGVTLEEAQDHCNDESTHGDGWFDGYQEE